MNRKEGIEVARNDKDKLASAHLVIETHNMEQGEKKKAIRYIDEHAPAGATVLTTSMQWTATEIASWSSYPERVIGFGAFADAEEAPAIEAAPALQTDPAHMTGVQTLFQSVGKEVEWVDDEVGLVYPRILAMIINEAAFALMENTASAEDIDLAMKKGTNYPAGPLEWAEKVGIDNVFAVLNGLHRQLGEERYRPASLIKKLVYAGWVGEETEKGFYHYENRLSKELIR